MAMSRPVSTTLFLATAIGVASSSRDAFGLSLPLVCSQIQSAIVFGGAWSFPNTSGSCSTESYTASVVNLIEGSQTVDVSLTPTSISHLHQAVRGGSSWAVYTAVFFTFEIPNSASSVRFNTSYPEPVLDEYVLQIQGADFSTTYWNGAWVSAGSPPSGALLLPRDPLFLSPGQYSGYFRFATYTPTGTGNANRLATLSIEASVPEPSILTLLCTGAALLRGRNRRSTSTRR